MIESELPGILQGVWEIEPPGDPRRYTSTPGPADPAAPHPKDQLSFVGMGGRVPSCLGTIPPPRPISEPNINGGPPRKSRPYTSAPVQLKAYLHRHDIRFEFKGLVKCQGPTDGKLDDNGVPVPKSSRGEIRGFSKDSARRLRFFLRQTSDLFDAAVTLTYPGDWDQVVKDGTQAKAHINTFCQWLRRLRFCAACREMRPPRSRRCACGKTDKIKSAYVWVLEFQPRTHRPKEQQDAPHFHFFIAGKIPKDLLSQRWYDIVGSGDDRHLRAGTQIKGAFDPDGYGAYMGAYISKLEQKTVPARFKNVGRFWGATKGIEKCILEINVNYDDAARELRTWRKANIAARREIVDRQKARAEVKLAEHQKAKTLYDRLPETTVDERDEKSRAARKLKKLWRSYRGCEFRAKSYARRWHWRLRGFVCLDGSRHFKSMMARQAVMIDAGFAPWRVWAESPLEKYKRLASRLARSWHLYEKLPEDQPLERSRKAASARAIRRLLRQVRALHPEKHLYHGPAASGQLLLDGQLAPEDRPDMDVPKDKPEEKPSTFIPDAALLAARKEQDRLLDAFIAEMDRKAGRLPQLRLSAAQDREAKLREAPDTEVQRAKESLTKEAQGWCDESCQHDRRCAETFAAIPDRAKALAAIKASSKKKSAGKGVGG